MAVKTVPGLISRVCLKCYHFPMTRLTICPNPVSTLCCNALVSR